MTKINLDQKFDLVSEFWHPYIIGELNDNFVKVAKLKGELIWHSHQYEDEMFVVLSGVLMMDFKDKTVSVQPGEILIVPKGVEHHPWTDGQEVKVMLIEPKATKHTGDMIVDQTVEKWEWI